MCARFNVSVSKYVSVLVCMCPCAHVPVGACVSVSVCKCLRVCACVSVNVLESVCARVCACECSRSGAENETNK